MLKDKTVLIIGAGASNEAGLPTGKELKEQIASALFFRFEQGKLTRGDVRIFEALERYARRSNNTIGAYVQAARFISSAMSQAMSIDHFLNLHSDNEHVVLCGKLAIVRAILKAEKLSSMWLSFDEALPRIAQNRLVDSWFNSFVALLAEDCPISGLAERLEALTLIIFNYDRCVEHYMFNSFQTLYGVDQTAAAEILAPVRFYHPYGVVGALPWQTRDRNVRFGDDDLSSEGLLEIASQIKTFTEGIDPSGSDIGQIRQSICDAKTLVFLGFAYHRINMQLLNPNTPPAPNPHEVRAYGTAKNISANDCTLIVTEVRSLKNMQVENVHIRNDLKSAGLFNEYWRSLSSS